ncbi:MAG: hemin-degrading factor [Terrimicrobiaceae bacterium]
MKTETTLKDRWEQFRLENPKVRIRDAARELQTTEATLLATGCGENVTRLDGDWKELIKWLPKLGRVMCLTRNEAAVHERYGVFRQIDFFHGMGQVVGPDIDLRLFMHHWKFGFAVTDQTAEGERQSLQFFDGHGDAVHKVFLQSDSDYGSYGMILNQFRSTEQSGEIETVPAAASVPEIPDAEIDVAGFQTAWGDLKDTHGFFPLLKKFQVSREQALRLAPEGMAWQVELGSARQMLEAASSGSVSILVFIGSRGCLQIHTGEVKNIRMFGGDWLNVLDEEFNMHLRMPLVARAWVVRKPTTDGVVTSLELFDAEGGNPVIFFGKRKPGEPEDERWRGIVHNLPRLT